MKSKYYALYDEQLQGFKNIASQYYNEVLCKGAERAYDLSQNDNEPCSDNLNDMQILEEYGYSVKEVTKEQYETIINSDDVGLLTTVKGV